MSRILLVAATHKLSTQSRHMKHSLCEMASKSVNFSLSNKSKPSRVVCGAKETTTGRRFEINIKNVHFFRVYSIPACIHTSPTPLQATHFAYALMQRGRPGGKSRVRIAPLQYDDIKINIREQKRKVYVYLSHRDSYHIRKREKNPSLG